MITQNIILFAVNNPPVQVINATQGENAARILQITVLNASGEAIPLTGKQAYLYVDKTDKNIVEETGVINGDTAVFTLHTQAMTCPGRNKMFMQIVDGQNAAILRVDGMILDVLPCNVDKAVPSETVLTAVQEATINANAAAENANTAAATIEAMTDDIIGAESLLQNHISNVNNPHAVTAEQVGALSLTEVEYGSFTPKLKCTTTNPTYTTNYAYGYYERIGRLCHITLVMSVSITNAGSGSADIGGLPFVNAFGSPQGFCMVRSSGALATENPAGAYLSANGDSIRLTNGNLNTSNTYKVGNGYIGISMTYRIPN